jgi:hypothetical protein
MRISKLIHGKRKGKEDQIIFFTVDLHYMIAYLIRKWLNSSIGFTVIRMRSFTMPWRALEYTRASSKYFANNNELD